MERLDIGELKAKYAAVCGETTNTRNRTWLVRRIAWRLQANALGGLSERAKQRARELANDADLRATAPKNQPKPSSTRQRTVTAPISFASDDRLPVPGSLITREYKGKTLRVKVLAQGSEFEGIVYKSLSAVAKLITGTHCNGFHFFRLAKEARS